MSKMNYYTDEIGRTGEIAAWAFAITYAILYVKSLIFGGDFENVALYGVFIIALLLYELVRYGKVAKYLAESSDFKIKELENEVRELRHRLYKYE